MFWAGIWKIPEFLSENFPFWVVKFSIYLNRRAFVMKLQFYYVQVKIPGIVSYTYDQTWKNTFVLFSRKVTTKHAYSNILKILQSKKENFKIKISDIVHIPAQTIDCWYSVEPPRRGGSKEYPRSMFWAQIRTIMYTPINPSFTI